MGSTLHCHPGRSPLNIAAISCRVAPGGRDQTPWNKSWPESAPGVGGSSSTRAATSRRKVPYGLTCPRAGDVKVGNGAGLLLGSSMVAASCDHGRNESRPLVQTSRPEPPANDPRRTRSACNGKKRHPSSRSPYGQHPDAQTKDTKDTTAPERRSRGRSQTVFYNTRQPHSTLAGRTPDEAYGAGGTQGTDGTKTEKLAT